MAVLAFLEWDAVPRELTGVAFVSAISVAAADTLASEIGVFSEKTYLFSTFERVPPGTNGGVSGLGQLSAILAAIYTAAVGWFVLTLGSDTMPATSAAILIPAIVGFLGCQVDSLLGATLENRGLISKKMINFVTTALGAVMGFWLLTYFV